MLSVARILNKLESHNISNYNGKVSLRFLTFLQSKQLKHMCRGGGAKVFLYFPEGDFPPDSFPKGNFPKVQFPKRQLSKCYVRPFKAPKATIQAERCGKNGLRGRALQLGQTCKAAAWDIANLGSFHLEKWIWEST